MRFLSRIPLFAQLILVSGLLMQIPAVFGATTGDLESARIFFYAGIFTSVLALFGAIASYKPLSQSSQIVRRAGRNQLLILVSCYTILPCLLAIPFLDAIGNTTALNAYFEMVSALTTTGATLFDTSGRLPDTVHLWRSVVGWLGGFIAWLSAIAILAPLNLGGFEVIASRNVTYQPNKDNQIIEIANPRGRIAIYTKRFLPIYLVATALLWLLLTIAGETPFIALTLAMATLSTSGISPVGGLTGGNGSLIIEASILIFLFFALSRKSFTFEKRLKDSPPIHKDPEIKIAIFLAIIVTVFLYLRHWAGALEIEGNWTISLALESIWGSVFTILSFLTTLGFESTAWDHAKAWAGLQTPGVLLLGLAIFGGGAATTAGGVKLVRLYALVRHGEKEIEKLVSPNYVSGAGRLARRIRKEGAQVAWHYFMAFALTIALVMLLLSLLGQSFEEAAIFTISAITTTGPLVEIASNAELSYVDLGSFEKIILMITMILGRLELLAIIALLNPNFWRM